MPLSLPIRGSEFRLREFIPDDAPLLADIEFDPEVKQFLAVPNKPKDKWIIDVRRDGIRGWVIETDDGYVAGSASLTRAKRKGDAELRIVIGRTFWGRALGSRVAELLLRVAFNDLSARAVIGVVHPKHIASIRLLRSLRFRRRGVANDSSAPWQVGHFVYRLTRGAYNTVLVPTGRECRVSSSAALARGTTQR